MDFKSKNKEIIEQQTLYKTEEKNYSEAKESPSPELLQTKEEATDALQKILNSEESLSLKEIDTSKIDQEIKNSVKENSADSGDQITEDKLIIDIRNSTNIDTSDINIISKAETIVKTKDKVREVKSVIEDAAEYKKKRRQEQLGKKDDRSKEEREDYLDNLKTNITLSKLPAGFEGLESLNRELLQDSESANKEFATLKDSMTALFNKLNQKDCNGKEFAYAKEFYALRDAATEYLDTHAGHRFSKKGKRRQKLAKDIKARLDNILVGNEILRDIRIDNIEKSRDLYSPENDAVLLDIGKLELKARHQDTEENINMLTPEQVRISRIIRREKRCSAIVEKKLGKSFAPDTGLDGRCLIMGADRLFSFNSDGSPATPEDAELLKKNLAYAEAFMDEDKTKRNVYLDELINKMLKMPIDPEYYRPEKILKSYEKYRGLSLLIANYQNLFEQDTYNRDYLLHQPDSVQKRLAAIAKLNVTYSTLISLFTDQYDVSQSDGACTFTKSQKPQRIEKMDEYDVIMKSEGNSLISDDSSNEHSYDKYVKKAMKGKDMVECEKVREEIRKAKLDDEDREEILNEFNRTVMKKNYYCLDNSNVAILENPKVLLDANEETKNNLPPEVNIIEERAAEVAEICAHLYHENEREEYESKLKEYYKWNYTSKNPRLTDEKVMNAVLKITTRKHIKEEMFNNSNRKGDINLPGDKIDRLIRGVLKPVLYDGAGNPANEEEMAKEEWNNKYLNAFADNDHEALKECIKSLFAKLDEFSVDKALDTDYVLENIEKIEEISGIALRYSNLKGEFPEIFDSIREDDQEEYENINNMIDFLTAWDSYMKNELTDKYGIAIDTKSGLVQFDGESDPKMKKQLRIFYNNELFNKAEAAGLEVPGLQLIEEEKSENDN